MNDDALDRLFPSMSQRPQGPDTALGAAGLTPYQPEQSTSGGTRTPEIGTMTEQQIAERMFGQDPGAGQPLESYDHVVDDLLSNAEREARAAKDELTLAELAQTRQGLNESFRELGVGGSEAKQLMAEFKERLETPRQAWAIAAERDATAEALRQKWGPEFNQRISEAKQMIARLETKIPRLRQQLESSGLGNSQKLIETLAAAARRRR